MIDAIQRILLMSGNVFQRMPKSPQLIYCCFVNNIRYLILVLLIACSSILFANIILYSIAVMYDDYQVIFTTILFLFSSLFHSYLRLFFSFFIIDEIICSRYSTEISVNFGFYMSYLKCGNPIQIVELLSY